MEDDIQSGSKERRRHRRFPCEGLAEVLVFHPHMLFRGRICDVSRSGCYVETRAQFQLRPLLEVELRFTLNGHHVSVLARLMAVHAGRGAGFEFLAADPRLDSSFHAMLDSLDRQPEDEARDLDEAAGSSEEAIEG